MGKMITSTLQSNLILKLFLFFYLIIAPVLVQAAVVTESDVRTAVQTWVRYVTADARPDAVIEKMEAYTVDGITLAYIAHIAGGGFCLCSADDRLVPVYLYSPDGTYNPDNPNYSYVLWEIAARTNYTRMHTPEPIEYQQAIADRRALWSNLTAEMVPTRDSIDEAPSATPTEMELDLTSQWHPKSPYNDQCPNLIPGQDEHCEVGCVATATAQIMYYWKWPNTGHDTASVDYNVRWRTDWDSIELDYTHHAQIPPEEYDFWIRRLDMPSWDDEYLRINGYWDQTVFEEALYLSDDIYKLAFETLYFRKTMNSSTIPYDVNFDAATYNWSIMADTNFDPPDPGAFEAAKLCYHVGVAIDMKYGYFGSGANSQDVPEALESHFRYDPDAVWESRNPETAATLIEEIQWLRPVLYGGFDDSGQGHVWVVYGYNTDTHPYPTKFKMNFGQKLFNIGWYTLDNIYVGEFNNLQRHVTHIAPAGMVGFVGGDGPGDGSPTDPYANIQEAIQNVQDGATLIFKAGSVNYFTGASLVINKPLTLKGFNIKIRAL